MGSKSVELSFSAASATEFLGFVKVPCSVGDAKEKMLMRHLVVSATVALSIDRDSSLRACQEISINFNIYIHV